jgi:NAD(P)-dependent dehydrogenase (short-subunit alcohol dehydrogenase family)
MKLDFSDQVVAITGAARGLGAAAAKAFRDAGAKVVEMDIDPNAPIPTYQPPPPPIRMDVSDEASVEAAFAKAIGQYGRLDVLVNSAGIAVRHPATEISIQDWQRVQNVNLTGTFLCSRVAARQMKRQGGGAIVNLASIMGLSGGIFPNASYQASKGGVVNLTRALALEWAEHKIRVNAVAPTFVRTGLTVPVFSNPDLLRAVMRHTPLGALPEPEDIANAIVFLASAAAKFITGVTLPVDSGYLAR